MEKSQFVSHRTYLAKVTDPNWFGYRFYIAAKAKYAAWWRYKQHPSHQNFVLHQTESKRMTATSKSARKQKEEVMKSKLTGPGAGSKTWWSLVKERQGMTRQDSVPPFTRPKRFKITSSEDKAALLKELFSQKMQVDDSYSPPSMLPRGV